MPQDELCDCIITLKEKVTRLEERMTDVEKDIKDLLRFMAEINMLVKLGIGGGALSLINLIVTILEKLN